MKLLKYLYASLYKLIVLFSQKLRRRYFFNIVPIAWYSYVSFHFKHLRIKPSRVLSVRTMPASGISTGSAWMTWELLAFSAAPDKHVERSASPPLRRVTNSGNRLRFISIFLCLHSPLLFFCLVGGECFILQAEMFYLVTKSVRWEQK